MTNELIATTATVLVSFLQLLVLIAGIVIYRRQTTIMEGSLAAAKQSADAARDSADETRNTARLTQCADVLIEHVDLDNSKPSFTELTRLIIHFQNFGPTRAINLRVNFTMSIGTSGDIQASSAPVVLGADGTAQLFFKTIRELMLVPSIPDIESGRMSFGFKGTISYDDVFGKDHEVKCHGDYDHFTRIFSWQQSPSKKP